MKVYVTGFAGDISSAGLADKNPEIIKRRFVPSFCRRFESLKNGPDGKALPLYPGIYEQLWHLSQENKCGFEIRQELIPIRQETIEICELFDDDPYQIPGSARVFFADAAGPDAACIGHVTDNNDKIIKTGEITRYLNRT